MVTILVSLGVLSVVSVMGYYLYHYKAKALSNQIKYDSTKSFADQAATRILELEAEKISLSEHVLKLSTEVNALKQSLQTANPTSKNGVAKPFKKKGSK